MRAPGRTPTKRSTKDLTTTIDSSRLRKPLAALTTAVAALAASAAIGTSAASADYGMVLAESAPSGCYFASVHYADGSIILQPNGTYAYCANGQWHQI